MKEIRSGIRHMLSEPFFYDAFQQLVGAYGWRKKVIHEFVVTSLSRGGKVVDIGCGTADVLRYLPHGIEYIGFDRNPGYIKRAKERYRHLNASLCCEELSSDFQIGQSPADVVLALGLLHHLDDEQALSLLALAKRLLNKNGFLITLDPVFTSDQSGLARYIIEKDRGTAVRSESGYKNLALNVFSDINVHIDLSPLRIPYTGIVMVCFSTNKKR